MVERGWKAMLEGIHGIFATSVVRVFIFSRGCFSYQAVLGRGLREAPELASSCRIYPVVLSGRRHEQSLSQDGCILLGDRERGHTAEISTSSSFTARDLLG